MKACAGVRATVSYCDRVALVVGRRKGEGGGRTQGHALDFGVRERDAQVVEGEHAVEGLDEELDL